MRGFTMFVHDVFLQFRTHLRGSSSDCSAAVIREGAKRKKPPPVSLRRWVRNFFSLASCFSRRPKRSSGRNAGRSRLNRRLRGSPDSLRCASQHILQDITSDRNWESELEIRQKRRGEREIDFVREEFLDSHSRTTNLHVTLSKQVSYRKTLSRANWVWKPKGRGGSPSLWGISKWPLSLASTVKQ